MRRQDWQSAEKRRDVSEESEDERVATTLLSRGDEHSRASVLRKCDPGGVVIHARLGDVRCGAAERSQRELLVDLSRKLVRY